MATQVHDFYLLKAWLYYFLYSVSRSEPAERRTRDLIINAVFICNNCHQFNEPISTHRPLLDLF